MFELYPNKGIDPNDNIRLGFKLKELNLTIEKMDIFSSYLCENNMIYIVLDPDGRKIELS